MSYEIKALITIASILALIVALDGLFGPRSYTAAECRARCVGFRAAILNDADRCTCTDEPGCVR
jgi:hypothetical protein